MGYFMLAVLALADVTLLGVPVIGNINCIRTCSERRNYIVCNQQSLILISDVTNLMMEKIPVAFENIKRDCMGRDKCDPSRTCNTERQQILLVHYACVNGSNTLSRVCNWPGVRMNGSYGHIQSQGYPAATSISDTCRWEIVPPSDSAVVLSLNDIVIKNSKRQCEEFLVVSSSPCDGRSRLRQFCIRDNVTTMLLCGTVDIQLRPFQRQSVELRFWLSFRVWPRNQVPNTQNQVTHCSSTISGSEHHDDEALTTESTTLSGNNSQDSNTEVLVIMLSIISGISVVLLIILVVVCVRCRLLQASRAEFAYSDASPSMPAHYMYISSSEPEKAGPQLADGYFEVADALHFTQRIEPPTTPAYAEVEQFPQPGEVLQSSSSEEVSRGNNSLNKKKQHENVLKNVGDKQIGNPGVRVDSYQSKHGVLSRLKKEIVKQGYIEGSTNIKSIPTSVKTEEAATTTSLDSTQTRLHSQINSDDDGFSNYETIGKFSPTKLCSNSTQRPQIPPNRPQSKTLSSERLPPFLDKTCAVMNTSLKTDCDSRTGSSNLSERSKTLPRRNTKASFQKSQANNNDCRQAGYKDMPRGSGIVKNGIKKFEQHST